MALSYIEAGIYINPVYVTRKPDGKKDVRPVGLWRQTSALSADPWKPGSKTADAGIMIDCGKSGLVVVDCDGEEGIANWYAFDPPPPLWSVLTASGGRHDYYRAHPDHPIGNDQSGKVAPKVDVRGLGGLVIAPPTTDGQGGAWTGTVDPIWDLDATVPAVVIERMAAKITDGPNRVVSDVQVEGGDALFDEAQRRFTRAQATEFIAVARRRLAETRSGYNGAINNFAMVCSHFPWLVSQELCGRLVIRSLGPHTGWTAPDDDDRATIASAYGAGSWLAVEVEGGVAAGATDKRLLVTSAADMAYWLQENAGRGRMSGFFLRQGVMVHTPRVDEAGYVAPRNAADDNGPAEIRPVTAPVLGAKLQYAYDCYKIVDVKDAAGKKTGETTEVAALFPVEAARRATDAPEAMAGLRALDGITGTPTVRADGTVLATPGYDAASRVLFLPEPGVVVSPVPDRPDDADVAGARKLLLDMIADFPFVTDDDRANYLGLLLTPLLRQIVPPSYKMFGIGAHQPGSGKSLLAEIAGAIHGSVLRSDVPEDEAEWRKQTFSILATTAAPLVVIDNVMGVLKSSVLAGVLTAGRDLTDRELGTSRTMTVANDRIWVVTGNNLSIGGDLVRRTVTILIDPNMPDPEKRTGFSIPDLLGWVTEHRNEVLHALLVLIRAWVVAGMPEPARAQSDGFARWSRVVSGVLQVAGVAGAFDADSGKRAAAGGDDDGLARVLDHLRERFGDASWSVADALSVQRSDGLVDFLSESRDWLPAPVVEKLARSTSELSGRIAFGWWLRNRIGRWVTTTEGKPLVVQEASAGRTAMWRVGTR